VTLLSLNAYAKHRSCALSAVQKAIATNRIKTVLDEKGRVKIDPVQADADWEKNTDHSKRSPLFGGPPKIVQQNEPRKSRRSTAGGTPPAEPQLNEPVDDSDQYRQARADREHLKLTQERLDLAERLGQIIDVRDASLLVSTALRTLRDRAMTVPFRLSAELAALTDVQQIESRLMMEIEAALMLDETMILQPEREDDDDDV
jgi:hypothetical protein